MLSPSHPQNAHTITHTYTHCLTDWRGVKSSTPGSQSRQFSFVKKIVILPLLWWSHEPCLWFQESAAPLSSVALTKLLLTASCQPALSCLSSSPASCSGRPRFGLCPPIRPPCPPALPLSCLTSLMKVCLFIFPDSLCCPSPSPPTFSMCTFQFFPASPPLPHSHHVSVLVDYTVCSCSFSIFFQLAIDCDHFLY